MEIHHLICFDANDCEFVKSLQVMVESKADGGLQLRYELIGDLSKMRIPLWQEPSEVEGLWNHTCFEAFVAVEGEAGYQEYNFSPSGQWAAFAFAGYRKCIGWSTGEVPEIVTVRDKDGYLKLVANIAASELPNNSHGRPLQLGLTAVIESRGGDLSYWALVHPSDRPDFHHRGGFACILSPKK